MHKRTKLCYYCLENTENKIERQYSIFWDKIYNDIKSKFRNYKSFYNPKLSFTFFDKEYTIIKNDELCRECPYEVEHEALKGIKL